MGHPAFVVVRHVYDVLIFQNALLKACTNDNTGDTIFYVRALALARNETGN
jgi:hypothetical protein